jgi:hypothetical protein
MEFQKKDYRKALAIYRQALQRISDPLIRGDGKSFLYAGSNNKEIGIKLNVIAL